MPPKRLRFYNFIYKPRAIKKYIYKVQKEFTLVEGDDNELAINESTEDVRGSSFSVGDSYVDYESEKDEIVLTSITKVLIKKGFLTLDSETGK